MSISVWRASSLLKLLGGSSWFLAHATIPTLRMGNLGIVKNEDSFIWNLVPNTQLSRFFGFFCQTCQLSRFFVFFCHRMSTAESVISFWPTTVTPYQLITLSAHLRLQHYAHVALSICDSRDLLGVYITIVLYLYLRSCWTLAEHSHWKTILNVCRVTVAVPRSCTCRTIAVHHVHAQCKTEHNNHRVYATTADVKNWVTGCMLAAAASRHVACRWQCFARWSLRTNCRQHTRHA